MRTAGVKKSFAFGIVTSDPQKRSRFQSACEHLGRRLGGVVYPQIVRSYADLEDTFIRGALEIAWTPPLVAAELVERKLASVCVISKRDSAAQYRSVIFVRRDSGRTTMGDLAGAHVAWVDPTSASGYIVPRAYLRDNGHPPDELFAFETMAGSHGAVARMVLAGEVDAGATFALFTAGLRTTIEAGWTEVDPKCADDVHVVVNAGIVPADCIAVSSRLAPDLQKQLADAFVGLTPEQRADFRKSVGAEAYERPPAGHGQSLRRLRLEAMRSGMAKRSG